MNAAKLARAQSAAPSAEQRWKRVTLVLLCCAGMITTLSQLIYIPSVVAIRGDLGASNFEISLTLAGYSLAMAAAQLMYGPLVDRLGPKRPMLFGLSLFAIASAAISLAPTIEVVVMSRIAQGLGISASAICGSVLIANMTQEQERDRYLAIFQMFHSIGAALGPAIGAVLGLWFSWRVPFLILTLWAAVTVAILAWRIRGEQLGPRFSYRVFVSTLLRPRLLLLAFAGACVSFVIQAFHTSLAFLFSDFLNITAAWTGFVFMAIPLGVLTGSNIALRQLHAARREQILLRGMAAVAVCTGLFALIVGVLDGMMLVVMLIGTLYLIGISLGLTFSMINATVIGWSSSFRGTALSAVSFARFLGAAGGPIAVGLTISFADVSITYSMIFLIAVVGAYACLCSVRWSNDQNTLPV
jgi:MFS family permease